MKTNLILAALLAGVLITSGCLDSMEDDELPDQDIEDELPEQPEETETEQEDEANDDQASEQDSEIDREVTIAGGPGTSYDVDQVEVEEGETIRFNYVHEGGQHDLVLERDGERVAGTEILTESGAEESFTYTFEEEGEYQFYCSVGSHRAQGMEGNIIFS